MSQQQPVKVAVEEAAAAHTNLNVFAAVASLLEAGLLTPSYNDAAERILRICQAEQAKQLRRYDGAIARALKGGKAP